MTTYEWFATDSAPTEYPMRIVRGDLHFPTGSVALPDGATINNGWGATGALHIVGERHKPLPNKLSITWFSYAEDKFYGGEFDLPADAIASRFSKGFLTGPQRPVEPFRYIVVGVGTGGAIGVWVAGEGTAVEVALLHARPVEVDWKYINGNPNISREEYIRRRLTEALGEKGYQRLRESEVPISVWEQYRTRYPWRPFVIGATQAPVLSVSYVNGERELLRDPGRVDGVPVRPRAIPRILLVSWRDALDSQHALRLQLDEAETREGLLKLLRVVGDGEVTLQVRIPPGGATALVSLSDGRHDLPLRKVISTRS